MLPRPRRNTDSRSERTARALPSWSRARLVKIMVCQGRPVACPQMPNPRLTVPVSGPMANTCCHSPRAKMLSPGRRGGRPMVSGSAPSTPRARPGRPWVTRLIHKIWAGGGVAEVEAARAVEGFLRSAGELSAGEHAGLLVVVAGAVDGEALAASRPALAQPAQR